MVKVKNKVKLSLFLIKHYAIKIWRSGGTAPPFFTSALDGGELSASRPACFIPVEIATGAHWIGGWVGSRHGLDAVEERKSYPFWDSGSGSPARSPSSSRLSYFDSHNYSPIVEIYIYNIREEYVC
jgi:hypothetical protein